MKNLFLPACFLFLMVAFLACEEDEAPVLTGEINGTVSLFDGYGYSLPDRSGVQVQLKGEDVLMESATDVDGHYTFQDVPYGGYKVNLVKENYVESILNFGLGHAGGDAPTLTSQTMNEIPEYHYIIDSITYNGSSKLYFYLQSVGANGTFNNITRYVHCFFSQSADVSCDNYENSFIDFLSYSSQSEFCNLYWVWYGGYYRFLNDYTGTVYCRIYPQTPCQEMWFSNVAGPHVVLPETLGEPSEVFAFTKEGITRNF
jgi:hypothetical protein